MRNGVVIFGLALLLGGAAAIGFRALGREPAEDEREAAASRVTPPPTPAAVVERVDQGTGSPPVFPAIASDCVERNNEATRLLTEGRLREAVELFRECAEEEPDETVYVRNLCEALVRLARREVEESYDLPTGIEALEEALALGVEREDRQALEDLLVRWKAEWEVARDDLVEPSIYFELAYDASRNDLLYRASEVMDLLDRAYVEFTDWFLVDPVRRSGRKLRVTFYDSEEFDRVTGLGDWAGGVFDGTIRLAVDALEEETERWSRVARHELVHAFIREMGGDHVPGWLNEGLAQWLDYSSFANSRRADQVRSAHARLKGTELFSLEQLQGSLASWTDRDRIARAYAQSLAMVAFVDRYYGRDALLAMVAGAEQEGGVAAAFRERTSVDLPTILIDLELTLGR